MRTGPTGHKLRAVARSDKSICITLTQATCVPLVVLGTGVFAVGTRTDPTEFLRIVTLCCLCHLFGFNVAGDGEFFVLGRTLRLYRILRAVTVNRTRDTFLRRESWESAPHSMDSNPRRTLTKRASGCCHIDNDVFGIKREIPIQKNGVPAQNRTVSCCFVGRYANPLHLGDMATKTGFEPAFSTLTGLRGLQTPPHGHASDGAGSNRRPPTPEVGVLPLHYHQSFN